MAVDLADGKVTTLVEGADFYSTPRVSPDGRQLAWLSWNHPNMPWDDTELYVAPFNGDGSLGKPRHVAGGKSTNRSSSRPGRPTARCISSRTAPIGGICTPSATARSTPVLPMEAEFGVPQWVFGTSDVRLSSRTAASSPATRSGGNWRRRADRSAIGQASRCSSCHIRTCRASERRPASRAIAIAGSPTEPESLVEIDLASGKATGDPPQLADRARPGLHVDPGGDRVSDRRRQDGPRVLLSADEPRLPRPGGRSAAAVGDDPRRADVRDRGPVPAARRSIGRRAASPCAT